MIDKNNFLAMIENALEPEISPDCLRTLLDFLKHYKPGDYIYMWPLRRATGFSDSEADEIFSILFHNGLAEPYAYIICPEDDCNHTFLVPLAEYRERSAQDDMRCPACDANVSYGNPQLAWKIVEKQEESAES